MTESERPGSADTEARERLTEWSQDDLHLTRSVRHWEPIYPNPAALRADVRELLAADVSGERLAESEAANESYAVEAEMARAECERTKQQLRERDEVISRLRAALGDAQATLKQVARLAKNMPASYLNSEVILDEARDGLRKIAALGEADNDR